MYTGSFSTVRVLLAEKDPEIVKYIGQLLWEDYDLTVTGSASQAMEILAQGSYDIVLLDLALTDGNGYSLCMNIKEKYDIPVIFVSATNDEYSVVTGLDIGADDYIYAPFRPRERLSRINGALRRAGKATTVLEMGNIRVDTVKAVVTRGDKEVYLSALEYRMLLIFLANKGRVLSREQLLEQVWDMSGDYVNDNTLTVYIKRIREKLEENPSAPQLIKTVRGKGYKIG